MQEGQKKEGSHLNHLLTDLVLKTQDEIIYLKSDFIQIKKCQRCPLRPTWAIVI